MELGAHGSGNGPSGVVGGLFPLISLSRDPRITARPPPAPPKRESVAVGRGVRAGPHWTRGSMAQRPRDRQEHPARIRASRGGRSHPCRRDRRGPGRRRRREPSGDAVLRAGNPKTKRPGSPPPGEPEGRYPRLQLPAQCAKRQSTAPARGNLRAGREGPLPSEVKRPQGPEVAGAVRGFPLRGAGGASPPQPQASVWSGSAGPWGQPLA